MKTPKQILCVDDDEDIQLLLRFALGELSGYQVTICSSGLAAIEKVSQYTPDLILLDYFLPEMDGKDILQALRRLKETRKTPVIFLTAKPIEDEASSLYQEGVIGIIKKPFDPVTLGQTLLQLYLDHQTKQAPTPKKKQSQILTQLQQTYVTKLPEKIEHLQQQWQQLCGQPEDQDTLQQLTQDAHNLAGSLGSYGYIPLSQQARELEKTLLKITKNPEQFQHCVKAINQLLTDIKANLPTP